MQEMWVRSLVQKDALEKEMATHCSILPGKSHGQRSLEGYSPQGGKKSDTTFDMTEQQQDPKTRKEEMGVFHPPWGKPFPRARRLRIPAL